MIKYFSTEKRGTTTRVEWMQLLCVAEKSFLRSHTGGLDGTKIYSLGISQDLVRTLLSLKALGKDSFLLSEFLAPPSL